MQTSVLDPDSASIARVYNVFLGGKDNYTADRELANRVLEAIPLAWRWALDHRAWQGRVLRYLAGTLAITQFIDCGCGLPTFDNTHDVVARYQRDSTVVYLDNDPSVLAHGRALLDTDHGPYVLDADLTRPQDLFADPLLGKAFDLDAPIGLLLCGTIHHIADDQTSQQILRAYRDLLPSGSCLALSHWHDPGDDSEASTTARCLATAFSASSIGPVTFRTRAAIDEYFTGLELIEPGLAQLRQWWPDGPPRDEDVLDQVMLAGVARKP